MILVASAVVVTWLTVEVIVMPYWAKRRRERSAQEHANLKKAIAEYPGCILSFRPEDVYVVTASTDRIEDMRPQDIVLPPGKIALEIVPKGGYRTMRTNEAANHASEVKARKFAEPQR